MIDVTVAMHRNMVVWPGDPPFSEEFISDLAEGAHAAVRRLSFSTHTGTHLDAPSHFIHEGGGVDSVPLSSLMGPVTVIDTGNVESITGKDLERWMPQAVPSRILFKTRNSDRQIIDQPIFIEDFVALEESAAHWLIEHHVTTVGIDYFSIEPFHNPGYPVHHILLKNATAVIEGLRLIGVEPGVYRLVALPLRVQGLDGSPMRVILENFVKE